MLDQGRQSTIYINKYNILKHLSNFELLEFKDWWCKLDEFERNGLGTLFKEIKSVLKRFLLDPHNYALTRSYKSKKYTVALISNSNDHFAIGLIRDDNVNTTQIDIVDGFEKFNNDEIENLLKCILKELIIISNFNQYNVRKDIDFYYDVIDEGNVFSVTIGVKNKKGLPLKIDYFK